MNQTQIGSFEHIPLAAIRPSTTNPRKHFDQTALDELTNSVRVSGVTVPVHVRSYVDPRPGISQERMGYELVTGERRFRAATAAGLDGIPSIVHIGMSDEDAMDLQMIENLQRADLHPVEEAEGYRALMAHGESAEDVAKKAGKTLGYVQQRLKLLTLGVDAKNLFASGHLTLGHALLLARLTAKDQERALLFLLGVRDWELDKKLSVSENIAKQVKRRQQNRELSGGVIAGRLINPTEAELKEWVTSHVLLLLKGVPWDLGDAELLPIAGACTTCPKRTGANAALFQDLTTAEDTCTDPACFADKQKAFTMRAQQLAKENGSPLLKITAKASSEKLDKPAVEIRASAVKMQQGKAVETQRAVVVATRPVKAGQWVGSRKGACPATVQAIHTDGANQGKLAWVCPDQKCKVHPHQVTNPTPRTDWKSMNQNTPENKAKREAEEAIEKKVNEAIGAEMLKADAQREGAIGKLIEFVVDGIDGMAIEEPDLCLMLDIPVPGYKADDVEDWKKRETARAKAKPLFHKFIEEATLPELHDAARAVLVLHAQESYDNRDMPRIAAMLGVDSKVIEKTVRAKIAAEASAGKLDKLAAAAATPAKKAAKKATKKKGGK
jgi:ParB family chromosome partitioning protein